MTLQKLNAADAAVARASLLRCCGSKHWAERMLTLRPFAQREMLLSSAESVWWALEPSDWLEAFSAHPDIGQKKLSDWASQEQSGVDSAPSQLRDQLASANQEYKQRFGWIFLINATGKSASDMLASLHARLRNESADELRVAAGEQAKITMLRLNKLLDA